MFIKDGLVFNLTNVPMLTDCYLSLIKNLKMSKITVLKYIYLYNYILSNAKLFLLTLFWGIKTNFNLLVSLLKHNLIYFIYLCFISYFSSFIKAHNFQYIKINLIKNL